MVQAAELVHAQLDDEEEAFRYPDAEEEETRTGEDEASLHHGEEDEEDDEEEFMYPGSPMKHPDEIHHEPGPSAPSPPRTVHPSPAQLEAIYAAGSSGDLALLQELIGNATASGEIEAFNLVNDASPRTGLTVVHACASRGQASALKWRTSLLDRSVCAI